MRLHKKGLIYKGSYMVNWSPNLQTAVSDLEVSTAAWSVPSQRGHRSKLPYALLYSVRSALSQARHEAHVDVETLLVVRHTSLLITPALGA